jgi:hypothetical protein
MLTIDAFEEAWKFLVEKYKLKYMTSTQRSESANRMLKNYVPPGSPMHMFARKYMRLLFDRESEENYEENRTRIVRYLLEKRIF